MSRKIINIGTDEAHIRSLQKQIHDTIKALGILNIKTDDNHIGGAQMAVYALHQVAVDLKGDDEHGKAFIEESLAEVLTFYKSES